jgi:hypothetical protein
MNTLLKTISHLVIDLSDLSARFNLSVVERTRIFEGEVRVLQGLGLVPRTDGADVRTFARASLAASSTFWARAHGHAHAWVDGTCSWDGLRSAVSGAWTQHLEETEGAALVLMDHVRDDVNSAATPASFVADALADA